MALMSGCVADAENLQQVDNMCMMRSAVEGHASLRTILWSLCGTALWRIVVSQLRNSAVISRTFLAPCWTKLSRSTCCSENCPPSGCQSNWQKNTKKRAWSQHWHFCSGTRMTATGFCTESSQVIKRGLHALPQKPSSIQYIGVIVGSPCKTKFKQTLSARKVTCMVDFLTRGETAKQCRNCDGPFRTRGAGWLVLVLSCCTITLGHTHLHCEHTSCRSSGGRCLIIHPIARTSRPGISTFSYTSRNSSPVGVRAFGMTERRKWVSNRRQTSKTQEYRGWNYGMTNVSIPEVNMLKNSWTVAQFVSDMNKEYLFRSSE